MAFGTEPDFFNLPNDVGRGTNTMVQSPPKPIAIDEFITNYGDSDCYELIDGDLIEMEPTGPHEQVSAFIGLKLNVQIDGLELPYFIPPRCLIKLLGTATAFRPDVLVL